MRPIILKVCRAPFASPASSLSLLFACSLSLFSAVRGKRERAFVRLPLLLYVEARAKKLHERKGGARKERVLESSRERGKEGQGSLRRRGSAKDKASLPVSPRRRLRRRLRRRRRRRRRASAEWSCLLDVRTD